VNPAAGRVESKPSETPLHLVTGTMDADGMEAVAMSAMKPVTPDEAAKVWRSIENPSARRVARALTQAGRRVHFATVARWRAQGFRPVASGPHPIEEAHAGLEVAARLLTGDPALGAEVFLRQSKASELESLTDGELLRRSTRELLILEITVCKELTCRCAALVYEKTAETGVLLRALASASRAASLALSQSR
jgi:hypothetical protein